ncbi:MAG: ATP-binding protein [Candidatus Kuenenia sp.]|nr:ATP-binding protein [Candidatus Kuenenia hertensis]
MDVQINPFEDDIVEDPRSIKTCVSSLNEKSLLALIERFHLLSESPFPRKLRQTHAWLVTSGEPGYGKSHLIGRLFNALNQKATLVYIRPFENNSTCWKSILLKIVQELDFAEKLDSADRSNNETPTQLEVFSHGIVAFLLSQLRVSGFMEINAEKTNGTSSDYSLLNNFLSESEKAHWVFSNIANLTAQFIKELKTNGIPLNASPLSWLQVLLQYMYNRSDAVIRETCLEWLRGECIDRNEAKTVGIRSRDVSLPEMTSDEMNELCKQRVIDFCYLAGFFRPFLFCFDQTENYGKNSELVRSFGIVIENLVSSCPNQMTVVTANQYVWEKTLLESMEEAHKHRFNKRFELAGINKEQGKELIQQRLRLFNIDSKEAQLFADEKWLHNLFKDRSQIGIRHFINKCRDQWDIEQNREVKVAPIEQYFEKSLEDIRSQPKRHVFDPDILYWMIFEVSKGLAGVTVKKYKTEKGYFSIHWLFNTRSLIFGFESGANSMRWRSIVREAKRYATSQKGLKAVMLRTFDLPKIPKATWKTIGTEINEAKNEFFNIVDLKKDMVINIYAANELYRDAVEGDIPYSRDEVLAFIRKKFTWFWDTISGGFSAGKERVKKGENTMSPAEGVANEIKAYIKKEKVLSFDELLMSLSKSLDKEKVLDICTKIPQIKVYQSPHMTLLQWQSNR